MALNCSPEFSLKDYISIGICLKLTMSLVIPGAGPFLAPVASFEQNW